MFRTHKYQTGFTLIELVITILLVSFLLVAVWMVYDAGFKVFYGQARRSGITPEVEKALSEFGKDLREALSVTAAAEASLTITADTDSNGASDTIQYTWGGIPGDPFNKITAVTRPMIHSVSNLAISYYDANNDLLPFPVTVSQVRRVEINITVTSGSESFTVRSSTIFRCL